MSNILFEVNRANSVLISVVNHFFSIDFTNNSSYANVHLEGDGDD